MHRLDAAERAYREPAPGVSLQVFDVGAGSGAGFLERLHRAMAVLAAHQLTALRQRLIEGAGQPSPTHLHLALRHHRRSRLHAHKAYWMPSAR